MQLHSSMLSHHGKQNGDEPLPLAISYYQLYCDIAAEANISTSAITTSGESDKNEGVTTVTTPNEQSDDDEVQCDLLQSEQEPTANHEQQQQQPWVEDTEWDAVREAAAERELRDNMARCRISSTTAAMSVPNTAPTKAAAAAWDQFYQHHQTSFFKDRHWPAVAFPNEFSAAGVLVEVGCGVGNTLLPLLEKTNNKMSCAADHWKDSQHHNSWTVYGLDLSPAAIELLQRDDRFQQAQSQDRAFAAVADIAQPDTIPQNWLGVATVTSLLFCLSAVDPVHQATAVANALATLRPGGILVLRDYGRYDEAQMKLGRQRQKLLQDNYYRKHDGTCCYYFTIERIRELFLSTSTLTEELECIYIRRVYANRLELTQRRRVWVQARFRKKEGPD